MCKSKADGGVRCAYHLKGDITGSVITYAATVTGLTRKQANEAFNDLKSEGQNHPAPADAEVDQFLERTAFNVSQDPNLSDARRETLMNRLRAALGRALHLDGATFYAWKNVIAEAWARSRRKVAFSFATGLMVFGVAACGDAPKDHNPAPKPSVVASAPASGVPSASPSPSVSIAPAEFSGEAVTAFGQDKVQAGYKEMAAFTSQQSFERKLLQSKPAYTADDFAAIRAQMTDRMRSDWDPTVAQAIAGDKQAKNTVRAVAYYDLTGGGYELATSGPPVVNESITSPTVSVDTNANGVKRLVVSFTHHGELRYTNNGTPVRIAFDKTATYRLVPAPAGSAHVWLIDGVQANYKSGKDIPDTTK
jgi:hypothetical protein